MARRRDNEKDVKPTCELLPSPVSDSLGADSRPPTPISRTLTEKTNGFLSRTELIALYGRAGSVLHRQTLSKFVNSKPPTNSELLVVERWSEKIKALLSHHMISLSDNKTL